MSEGRLTAEQVDHVAHLARLEITPQERREFLEQLGSILDYVGHLQELDTEGVDPTLAVFARTNVFREDEPGPPLGAEAVLLNAPDQAQNQFKIPRILEES